LFQVFKIHKNEEKKADMKEFLKVGDVILLLVEGTIEAPYSGFLAGDGVISQHLEVIPERSATEQRANMLTRICLFRIENARKVTKQNAEKSDSELRMALGKAITYGDRIQLQHIHSQGYLSLDPKRIAAESGCLRIFISSEGIETSWFEIKPVNKLRNT